MLAHLTREFHPLRFSQVAPFACDGSRPFKAVSTLGLTVHNLSKIMDGNLDELIDALATREQAEKLQKLNEQG